MSKYIQVSNFITDSKKEELNENLKSSLEGILNPPITTDLAEINENLPLGDDGQPVVPLIQKPDSIDPAIEALANDLTLKIDEYITKRMQYEILGHMHWHHGDPGYPGIKTKG
jgi:hypothetical protein